MLPSVGASAETPPARVTVRLAVRFANVTALAAEPQLEEGATLAV